MLTPLFESRTDISALEIGPGPKSVFGYLPSHLSRKIRRFTAFEPNNLFATRLEELLCSSSKKESPQFCLESSPVIHRVPFALDGNTESTSTGTNDGSEKFDVILFCHSMYGMKPKRKFIERALEMLNEGGLVVVFHRDGSLQFDGLVCHRTASFPTGSIRVANDNDTLDLFAPFVAGFVMQDVDVAKANAFEWRKTCRALSGHKEVCPDHLSFSAPEIMAAFTQHATALPKLTIQVPVMEEDKVVKNWEARLHRPASIVRPTEVRHIQQCVKWAREHNLNLTVIGGGHSGHCLRPNVVSIDMSTFDQIHIFTAGKDGGDESGSTSDSWVVAEAGCKTGDIVRETMAAGITVPLGARPSVGAGLWLQGGIGHLTRLYGLACDAIIGAVVVSVDSSQILYVGCVPSQHRPAGAVRPEYESDLLWAIKGAGTNFGIVISVTFKAQVAPAYSVRHWVIPLSDNSDAQVKLRAFEELVAKKLSRDCSADVYLYWDNNQLCLGVTMVQTSTTVERATLVGTILGLEDSFKIVDGVGLFETEMYMSVMHGGHSPGRTSSFKRCLFLKDIGGAVIDILTAAVRARPSPYCYFHLLHGGGAMGDVAADATAFGCRNWEFACVITGIWPHEQDGTGAVRAAVQWVYDTINILIPLSTGVYSADLGPDPRDASLADKAFGPNQPRLARLKGSLDPGNILAYTCPLSKTVLEKPPGSVPSWKLVILVTGESCVGKDYCANIWRAVFTTSIHKKARIVSISDACKQEYALATGADLDRLLQDRAYKEQHRPALTAFFQDQVRQRPRLPEEHFVDVISGAADANVLLITGMRDEMPVARFSHLVPGSRLLEVRVKASKETRRAHRGYDVGDDDCNDDKDGKEANNDSTTLEHRSGLIFHNDTTGNEDAIKRFAEKYLLSFFHKDLQQLANMIPLVPDFPRLGIDFRHVLHISQQRGGLALCTSLLQTHFTGDWAKVDKIVCCETGGFVFGPALAAQVNVPSMLIRKAGKLPPPTVSVTKYSSHISSAGLDVPREEMIEMARDAIPKGARVVVVDDVLATGKTLCAVLKLLVKAGIGIENINVMVVAEFPFHRGRDMLRQYGFGRVNIQSLLLFDNA